MHLAFSPEPSPCTACAPLARCSSRGRSRATGFEDRAVHLARIVLDMRMIVTLWASASAVSVVYMCVTPTKCTGRGQSRRRLSPRPRRGPRGRVEAERVWHNLLGNAQLIIPFSPRNCSIISRCRFERGSSPRSEGTACANQQQPAVSGRPLGNLTCGPEFAHSSVRRRNVT